MVEAFDAAGVDDFFGVEAHALEQLEPFEGAEGQPTFLGLNKSGILGLAGGGRVRALH